MSRVDREVAVSVADQLRSRARQAGWAADPVKWAHDVLGVHLWSKQREIAESVVHNKRTVVASCHGTGKALAVDTPIPTPDGMVAMGDITPGMEVLGSSGQNVKVVATTGIHVAERYRITFENEAGRYSVVASGDHIWPVLASRDVAMAAVRSGRSGVPVHTGLWHHRAVNLTTHELARRMRDRRRLTVPAAVPAVTPRGPRWESDEWMSGLFAGLGHVDSSGRAALTWRTNDNRKPMPGELFLARAWMTQRGVRTVLSRKRIRATAEWTLSVAGDHAAWSLTDADDRAVVRSAHTGAGDLGWRIVSVRSEGPGPVRCIQVDAPDSLYLCGERMIPTHNSMIASVLSCWWVNTRPVGEAIVVSSAPTYAQVNKILWEEIRRHHTHSRQGPNPMIGRVTQGDEWKADDGQILAFGRKPPSGEQGKHAFQGIHRRYVLVILDECCHDDQTEVMTENGWKLFSELSGSERLLTMDPVTHEARYRLPDRIIDKSYKGKMFLYQAKGADFCVTPDHDMYVHGMNGGARTSWGNVPMEEMATRHNKYMKKVIKWTAPDVPAFTIPAWTGQRKTSPELTVPMDTWLEFLGWYLSEGHIIKGRDGRPVGIGISQRDEKTLEEIHQLCLKLGLPAKKYPNQVHIHSTQIGLHLAQFGTSRLVKDIPRYAQEVSVRQMNILLDSYARGDGYRQRNWQIIYTSSKAMADSLQEMILKTGIPSTVKKRSLVGNMSDFGIHVGTSSVDGYVISRPNGETEIKYMPSNLKEIDYEGRVYCATVSPEHLLFTRRNGYTMWSGNCGIGEELWTGAEAITTNDGCRILAIGNPDDRQTEFGNAFLKPEAAQDWNRISVPAASTPNFTGEPVPGLLNEVLVSKAWCEERLRAWGKDDPRYISKVLARFPEQSKSSLFPPALVAAASEDVPPQSQGMVLRLGVDVARFGTDQNVVVSYLGTTAKVEQTWTGTDTVSSAHMVAEIAERIREEKKCAWVEMRVDAVGLGAGVVDTLNARAALLKEPWFSVYEMLGSASPPVDVGGSVYGYGNARAYWYDQLRQSMRNGRTKIQEDERIRDDLAIVFYKFKAGKLYIISKEEMRKEHGRSPDYADALVYATAPVPDGLPAGSSVSQDPDDAISGFMEGLDDSELMIAPF